MFLTKKGSLEVEVEMGRQILGMLLTMYLPTTLMNIIGKAAYFFLADFSEIPCFRPYNKLYETVLL